MEERTNERIRDDYRKYYDILDSIGYGAFGTVYKGKDKITNELRAIKVIELEKIEDNLLREYEMDEIESQLKLCIDGLKSEFEIMKIFSECKNSVKCYEYFSNEKYFVFVMELCDKDLSKLLSETFKKNNRGFNEKEIYEIMTQLNEALKLMKNNKIVHKDLKLENIFIKYEDKQHKNYIVKLTDYGCSERLNSLNDYCNSYVGTTIYMAPELLMKEEYNYKCDLWAIGIIIYRLYFCKSPFLGVTENAIKNKIKNFRSSQLKKTGIKELDDLIQKLLEKEKEKRINWDEYFNHPFFKSKF